MIKLIQIFNLLIPWIYVFTSIILVESTSSVHLEVSRSKETPLCPSNCICSSVFTCDYKSTRIGSVKLPKSAENVTLKFISSATFNATEELGHLKLLRQLSIINLMSNGLPELPHLPSLTSLDINNNALSYFSSKPLRNNPQLLHLNASYNKIIDIDIYSYPLPNLKILDLSSNRFGLTPKNIFPKRNSLERLSLRNTGLRIFPPAWSSQLTKLKFLDLSNNNINSLSRLINMPELQSLDMSHNPLRALPSFKKFPKLTNLKASNTFITYIKQYEMKGCKLRELNLRSSKITNLNEGLLSECEQLQILDLSYNYDLWKLEHASLHGLKKLEILYLNNCPNFVELKDDVFNGLNNLKELYLQNSGIRILPRSLSSLTNMRILNIQNAPILCDCHAFWLQSIFHVLSNTLMKNEINCADGINRSPRQIIQQVESLNCESVKAISVSDKWLLEVWGNNATLECNVTGDPTPQIIWQTVDYKLHINENHLKSDYWLSNQISEAVRESIYKPDGKYSVLSSGDLLIRNVERSDIGRYKCFAFNPVSNVSVVAFLGLDDQAFRYFIIESILVGFACAAAFLLITLLVQLLKYIMLRFGWLCCCCEKKLINQAKQIKELIETVEAYKSAQLEKLKDNYNSQVVNIKDSCYQQMEKLRESYSHQTRNLKELCDYSSQQITGARDQYLDQVNKIRDYSTSQMSRVRTNYVFQRNRIRKYSGHQMLRLRETYKYQQRTLNKLLENLPDLYIQTCRTGACQRTDSVMFDELSDMDMYYKVDFLHPDNQSFSSELYYTPNSTLTKKMKRSFLKHSRNVSTTSNDTDYHEATQSWLTPSGSIYNEDADIQRNSVKFGDDLIKEIKGKHRRCYSASGGAPLLQLFHPRAIVIEEDLSPSLPKQHIVDINNLTNTALNIENENQANTKLDYRSERLSNKSDSDEEKANVPLLEQHKVTAQINTPRKANETCAISFETSI